MIEDLSFLILLGLIAYTQIRKRLKFKGGEKILKCESCGRTIFEKPVKVKVDDKELVFCCEHCAKAYLSSKDIQF